MRKTDRVQRPECWWSTYTMGARSSNGLGLGKMLANAHVQINVAEKIYGATGTARCLMTSRISANVSAGLVLLALGLTRENLSQWQAEYWSSCI